MTLWKSKIGVVTGVISETDRSQKNQNVSIFFRLPLGLRRLRSAYNDLVKTKLSESEEEAEW